MKLNTQLRDTKVLILEDRSNISKPVYSTLDRKFHVRFLLFHMPMSNIQMKLWSFTQTSKMRATNFQNVSQMRLDP